MKNNTLLVDLHASLLKKTNQLATSIAALTGQPAGAVYLDSYADEDLLPAGDQVGFSGLTFDTDGQMVDGSFMIGFSTQTDRNLFRLTGGVNAILSDFMPGDRMAVVSGNDGTPKGFMNFVDDTRVMPVAGKASRPIQMIQVNFVTTLSYQP